MGELRTRKRGKKWEYSFEGARVNGKRKHISKGGFSTKAEALAAGTRPRQNTTTVAGYLHHLNCPLRIILITGLRTM